MVDYCTSLRIGDPSFPVDEKFMVNLFKSNPESLPTSFAPGDIIRIHGLKVGK
jgi:hypothetical protein